jgi:AcrR family transcriptional regulator
VLAYALSHGIEDLSLRPVAAAIGTSARMLVYHFGSREKLLHAIVLALRRREDATVRDWWKQAGRAGTLADFVRWYWRRLSAREAKPAGRLIFEVYAMALRDPHRFRGVLEDPVSYWKDLARRSGGRSSEADAQATFALAAVRGLFLDRIASGNLRRIRGAAEKLARSLEGMRS